MYSQWGRGSERGNWSLSRGLILWSHCECLAAVAIVPRCPDQMVCSYVTFSYVTFANEQPNLTHKRIQGGAKEEGSDHEKNIMVSSGIRDVHFGHLIAAIIVEYMQSFEKLHN